TSRSVRHAAIADATRGRRWYMARQITETPDASRAAARTASFRASRIAASSSPRVASWVKSSGFMGRLYVIRVPAGHAHGLVLGPGEPEDGKNATARALSLS